MENTVVKTNSKAFMVHAKPYILNAIDSKPYEIKTETEKEKLQFLADTFRAEYGSNIGYYGSTQNAFMNWIMGLPSVFNVDFENYRILEIAKEWGSLRANATEWEEYRVLENWFRLITVKTLFLMRANGINI